MIKRDRLWPFPDRVLGWLGASAVDQGGPLPGPRGLAAYARARWPRSSPDSLAPRLRLLVAQLVAERSGCGYCTQYNRHLALRSGIAAAVVDAVTDHALAPQFSEPERAALALADALTGFAEAEGGFAMDILVRARCHLGEDHIMAIVSTVASEHFFDPASGRLGRDALAQAT